MATKAPSSAQIAAAIKTLNAAKAPAKKKAVTAKSKTTKKAPSARLKARRAKPAIAGYFPNPVEIAAAHKTPRKPAAKKTSRVKKIISASHPYCVQVEREGKWFPVADFHLEKDAKEYAKSYAKHCKYPVGAFKR